MKAGPIPGAEWLRRKASRRSPRAMFDFVDGGAGDGACVARNARALDSLTLVPRYGFGQRPVRTDCRLFGRDFAFPFGIAPMGLPGLLRPGLDRHLVAAAAQARIPVALSCVASLPVEEAARLAESNLWFQIYDIPDDDHSITLEMIDRAARSGVEVLVATMDVPAPALRYREMAQGMALPFRPSARQVADMLVHPAWLAALLREGSPWFGNLAPHADPPGSRTGAARLARAIAGGFDWDVLARIRDKWTGKLVLKGLLSPQDARLALALGADGIVVSNHGGRQLDCAPAAIDALPAMAAAVGGRCSLLVDSGFRSGTDIAKGLALGADAVLIGRPFLFAGAALGSQGPAALATHLGHELTTAFRQLGIAGWEDARKARPGDDDGG